MHLTRTKMLWLFTILLLGGFVTTSLLSYFSARTSLLKQITNQTLPLAADKLYAELLSDLSNDVMVAQQMANDTFVQDWVQSGEQDAQLIEKYLYSVQLHNDAFTAFYISDKSRRYYHSNGSLRIIDQKNEGDSWYFNTRVLNRAYDVLLSEDEMNENELIIFINYYVVDEHGKFSGVTGIGVRLTYIQQRLDSYYQQYKRRVYLVDHEGKVIFHDKDYQGAKSLYHSESLAKFADQILVSDKLSLNYNERGKAILLTSRSLGDLGWHLILEDGVDGINFSIQRVLINNIVGAVFITVIMLLLCYFMFSGYQRRLEKMATIDHLSKALNRSAFDVIYQQKLALIERGSCTVFSLALFDIDKFKTVNDTYGHLAGDIVIAALADVVRKHIRQSDVFCRWGGEEFLLMMPDCHAKEAFAVAEVIRQTIEQESFTVGSEALSVTISAGVIDFYVGEDESTLMHLVDEALYLAKQQGRNRVEMADKGFARP
jgi:diguanylate cyclase (GGDEF)-like protein